eukprot:303099-Pleurochrysis_carterae.AAC.4
MNKFISTAGQAIPYIRAPPAPLVPRLQRSMMLRSKLSRRLKREGHEQIANAVVRRKYIDGKNEATGLRCKMLAAKRAPARVLLPEDKESLKTFQKGLNLFKLISTCAEESATHTIGGWKILAIAYHSATFELMRLKVHTHLIICLGFQLACNDAKDHGIHHVFHSATLGCAWFFATLIAARCPQQRCRERSKCSCVLRVAEIHKSPWDLCADRVCSVRSRAFGAAEGRHRRAAQLSPMHIVRRDAHVPRCQRLLLRLVRRVERAVPRRIGRGRTQGSVPVVQGRGGALCAESWTDAGLGG